MNEDQVKVTYLEGEVTCRNCDETEQHTWTSDKDKHGNIVPVDVEDACDNFVATSSMSEGLCELCAKQERAEIAADILYDQMKEEGCDV